MDLLALCRTSRLINDLSTPLLYRCVDLCDIAQIETFVSALEKYAESPVPLWCHIQQFSITMLHESTLEHSLSNRITTVLSKCLNLHTLELITPHAHLSALLIRVSQPASDHNFARTDGGGVDENFHLAPIQLHNLTAFSGDSLFLRSLVCDNTLDLISIFFFDHDFEAALERLRPMTCSEEVELLVKADNIDLPCFFAGVAASMPQITSLSFRKLGSSSPGAPRLAMLGAISIQMQLGKLKYLRILEIHDFDEEPHDMTETFRVVDQLTVEKWSETCPSLTSIVLHGQYWERVGTEWEATSLNATPTSIETCRAQIFSLFDLLGPLNADDQQA
ncbi:hypothetical protein B0H13DRAFT_2365073 [Mycena leptocephala]|nr:hypothetical protein B0H13DRAFT_2365073 [Mycena leptocephala]